MIGKAFFENLADSANPVFIKEMRQYFQNRRMLIFIGGLLLAEFVCTLFFSASLSGEDSDSGAIFFLLIVTAGAILSILICAVGAEQRFSEERSDKELNYAMLTTLKPSSIILGKLEGSMVMTLCIFSLLLPFLAAAYFMRGLSLASLLIVLLIIPTILLNTLLGILAGSFGKRWVTVLYFIAIFNSLLGLVPAGFQIVSELMESAATEPEFWIVLGIEYGVTILVGILLFLLAVAVVAPPKSNRLLPVKVYLFLLPFISLAIMMPIYLVCRSYALSFPKEAFFVFECLFSSGAFLVMLAIALFEQPLAGIRVYMKCPRGFFGRLFHFIFSTGFSGSIILAIPLMLIPAAMASFMKFNHSATTAICGFLCMLTTVFGTAVLSLLIAWRTKLPLPAWVWMIILLVVGTIAPLPVLIDEKFENFADSFRAVLMTVSPIQSFVEILEGGRAPTRGGLAMSAFVALVFFT
ncbi:MAG: hypothetical protein J6V24_11635, partial [Clostridia bacterium]|nr:hypothetical protein [Clostridia bacterium]